jgi:hypothetical protein
MANEIPDIPRDMRNVYRRPRRSTAKALHLEYGKLRHWAEAAGAAKKAVMKAPSASPRHARPAAAPTFMELIAPRASSPFSVHLHGD